MHGSGSLALDCRYGMQIIYNNLATSNWWTVELLITKRQRTHTTVIEDSCPLSLKRWVQVLILIANENSFGWPHPSPLCSDYTHIHWQCLALRAQLPAPVPESCGSWIAGVRQLRRTEVHGKPSWPLPIASRVQAELGGSLLLTLNSPTA